LIGRTVNELALPGELQVVAVTRGERACLPASGMVLQVGDRVHFAMLATSVERAKALLALK